MQTRKCNAFPPIDDGPRHMRAHACDGSVAAGSRKRERCARGCFGLPLTTGLYCPPMQVATHKRKSSCWCLWLYSDFLQVFGLLLPTGKWSIQV
ncbi:hypothetical protein [Oryza sativa Japonica Group]|uniref:Uncharacterized protein n=1 Tax=Oryza sativa subsp. japonica TaxID=39947 RepID=Q94J35_ORYSJ|nr:hypothetical protein [Oryza sativa Japonica Group]